MCVSIDYHRYDSALFMSIYWLHALLQFLLSHFLDRMKHLNMRFVRNVVAEKAISLIRPCYYSKQPGKITSTSFLKLKISILLHAHGHFVSFI